MSTIDDALARGLEHHRAGRLPDAEAIYRDILRQQPQQVDTLNALGALVLQTGRRDEAIAILEHAAALAPHSAVIQLNLGAACVMIGRHGAAQAPLQRALALEPRNADVLYHLGLLAENTDQVAEAIDYYWRAAGERRGFSSALNNLALLLKAEGQLDEAAAVLDAGLAADRQSAHLHYNRAMLYLIRGQFEPGWREYEWRVACPEFGLRRLPQPVWDGTPLVDKTLLVHAEQGLGDVIQFVRYLPLVRERCRRVIVETPAQLIPLFRHAGVEGLVEQLPQVPGALPSVPACDVQIPLLSLPRVFGTTLETIPAAVPYLYAPEHLVNVWRERLAASPGFKVGIVWQGRPTHRDDRFRSIALTQFAPLAIVPGVRLFSLQRGHGTDQLPGVAGQFEVIDVMSVIDPQAEPFLDLAAIIKSLDLVVACDTSIAHLAGALGAPVWMALATRVDWRWLVDRSDSPWYPTMRLFRQPTRGDWPAVFRKMAAELATVATGRGASTMEL
ncbi:MAG: tetratricopeptide repeat protein [Pirellulales bacterium]